MNVSISAKHFRDSTALVPTPAPAAIVQAGTRIAEALARGRAVETAGLRQAMEAACGGSDADGLWLWKDAYEAGEVAQVLFLRRFWPAIRDKTATPAGRLAMLGRIAGMLPTQTRRSEESEAFQQFSTPLPLGYVAALAAGLRPGERVLEPSAGTGLLAIHAELAGARLHLNELATTRAGLLGALYPTVGVTQLDAAQIHDRLAEDVAPSVVLMNPPFSVAAHVEGRYRDATAEHLRSALARLAPGGRLVAVTGEGFRPDRPSTAPAFAALAERGGRLVFSAGLSGRTYARHGTTVDVRLSVFDRLPVGELGAHVAPLGLSEDPAALLDAVLAGVPARLALAPVSLSAPASAPAPRSAIPGLTRRAVTRPAVPRPAPAAVAIESADPVAYAVIEELPATLAAEAALYETYALETLRIDGAQPHPTPLVQSTAMASVRLPRPSHAPRLPGAVVADGLLSDCQIETVIYAGAAHARHLPGHWTVDETGTILSAAAEGAEGAVRFRQGFFLGDGTGAGKGRQVAGIILDNWMQGRRRALWVSKSDVLLEDARRDWRHLGREPLQIVPLSRFAPGKPVTLGEGILFTTFATLRGAGRNGAGSRLDQICDWLGPDFDGVIALDEAHALANAAAGPGDRGVVEASQQGRAGLALQYRLPDARVLYVSATGAVTVEKLAYAHRLGLWGGGAFPFPTRADFVSAMQQGGLAAMEVLARDLKALGLYTARSLSYAGVEVEMLDHALTPEQTAIYDAYADAFQVIHTNLDAALKASGVTGASGTLNRAAKSAARSAFESSKQRFFNHLLTAMKCPSLIAAIEAGIEAGHAAVVQIVSTGEALMERRLSEIPSSEWGDLQVDMTPREAVMEYLTHAFPTQLYEPYSDDSGTILSRPVIDADGRPVQCREAVERRDALIEHLCGLSPVQSALDQILHHFGTGVVAEVTGRSRRIVRQTGRDGVDRLVLQNRPAAANLSETQAFQDDEKRILVFSDAGGTGRSYHADRGAKNQRLRVHYLLEAGWKADAAVQGLGRTNRTNQAQAPLFRPVTTDVKGERRFLSTIARRLDTLGAITRGQRQTGGQGLFRPEDNLEGPYAATALRQLFWAIVRGEIAGCPLKQFEAMTGLALTNEAGGLLDALPPIGRFLNRVLALRIAVQNLLFEAFEERLALVIEGAISAGVYDIGVEVLTAESFTVTDRAVAYTHPGSGAHTHLLTIAERRRLRPLDLDAALDLIADGYRPVVNTKSGRPALMGPAASETREDGSVVARVRLVRPLQRQILDRSVFERSHFTEATLESFRAAWSRELASLPEYEERTLYVVTGLLLPIWDRLPGIDMRVFRLVTDAGERIVGRVVEPEDLHVTRERLNLGAGSTLAPVEAFAALLGGRASLQLAGGLQVKRVRVMGEDRIELIGSSDSARAGLKALGLFAEVIAWRTRLFVPTGERGTAILTALLDRHPLLRCTTANGHA